jgi:hypothetical protein
MEYWNNGIMDRMAGRGNQTIPVGQHSPGGSLFPSFHHSIIPNRAEPRVFFAVERFSW